MTYNVRINTQQRLLVDVQKFAIPAGHITVLFGESGIGKSLIARAIYGILDSEEFDIHINGESYENYLRYDETKEIKKNGFYVFQEPSSHLNPLLQIGTQMREGDLSQSSNDSDIMKELWSSSNENELQDFYAVYPKPYRPSGGEKQRLFLAMALKKIDIVTQHTSTDKPLLFVFDEPTGSLDNYYRNAFLSLLFQRFVQHHITVLLITHDYSMVSEIMMKYQHAIDRVSFKELSRSYENVILRDFKPEAYLGWLKHEKESAAGKSQFIKNNAFRKLLLRVESGAEVFGRKLIISKEQETKETSPLDIFAGSMTYVKAQSGIGKTTLVKMVMGLVHSDKLRAKLGDMMLTERTPRNYWQKNIWGRTMTMVFQHADEALNPKSTVEETFYGLPAKKQITQDSIRETLSELFQGELNDSFLKRRVSELSGGQKQRLNLLRGLFLDTDIIILDEPLNGLDFESSIKVLSMLKEKQSEGKGILLISHNEEIFDTLTAKENVYYLRAEMKESGK